MDVQESELAIEALPGYSNTPYSSSLLGLYFSTMKMLLEWGIQVFLDYASMPSPRLWDSITVIDGLRGYKVRCVASMQLVRFGSCCPYLSDTATISFDPQ